MLGESRIWLINIPHAGGSTAAFKKWNKKVNCNVLNIEYPGHWTRMNEPMIETFTQLAGDVINTIENNISKDSSLMIFGHSVGAIMAWYISPILMEKGYILRHLFLSASHNPGSFPEKSILMSVTDCDMLRLIGYKVEEHDVNFNNKFMKIFLPILKNDINVCKSFLCDDHYVDVSSTVLYGTDDIFTELDELQKWSKYVKLYKMQALPGEHLFIEEKSNIDIITDYINRIITSIEKE